LVHPKRLFGSFSGISHWVCFYPTKFKLRSVSDSNLFILFITRVIYWKSTSCLLWNWINYLQWARIQRRMIRIGLIFLLYFLFMLYANFFGIIIKPLKAIGIKGLSFIFYQLVRSFIYLRGKWINWLLLFRTVIIFFDSIAINRPSGHILSHIFRFLIYEWLKCTLFLCLSLHCQDQRWFPFKSFLFFVFHSILKITTIFNIINKFTLSNTKFTCGSISGLNVGWYFSFNSSFLFNLLVIIWFKRLSIGFCSTFFPFLDISGIYR